MKKGAIFPVPKFYDRYINLVPDVDLKDAFKLANEELNKFDVARYEPRGNYAYAADKWTMKDVFLHMADAERVFMYRAMVFARNDKGPLPGFDEEKYAANTLNQGRSLSSIVDELKATRMASEAMFLGFNEAVMLRTGVCWKIETSVLALGFTLIGHQLHHFKVLREKYL
ncbi:DinB family protein [Chitinophaga sp. CB10]|uniref:DinB family protein n=1 Tax=Chitinophaga sp. CB10 TaxID=1891659 RepID=UPI0025BEB555|nr:DinB family protein [Chitinophaga sp. CB10]